MKKIALFFVLVFAFSCKEGKKYNPEELRAELDSIMIIDQMYRSEINSVSLEFGTQSTEFRELMKKLNFNDSSNLARIDEIIELVGGYPGNSVVGPPTSRVAFFVIQHSGDQQLPKYYELILKAGESNELDKNFAAIYYDRYLMHQGKLQKFGTQVQIAFLIDSVTGMRRDSTFLWPIADTTKIDSVRMWNGLGSLEDYLNDFGISRW